MELPRAATPRLQAPLRRPETRAGSDFGSRKNYSPCDEPALDRIKVTDKGGPSAPEAAGLVKGGTLGEATFCDALQSGSTASLTRAVVPAAADTYRVAGAPAATPWKRRGAITLRTGFVFIDVDKL